ncbi:TCP-1/cpn60 chaperonin family protein [Candidatus Woesearchaeota archaeon]|nr:TCP-1/cpn60 chaperonin family protein [Candidatus Woesearchaeota archaeon]
MATQNQQPIYILSEGSKRTVGKDAQRNNILAAKLVAETVRTTLGPKGMDKMLVDSLGDITVTNDGVTILQEMQIEHPAAKMVVEVAKTQENEVGDGTTTAVVLAGELLKNAEQLLDKEIHPTVITRGYRQAAEKSQEILKKIGEKISIKDTQTLKDIAMTAMTGKGAEVAKEKLADLIVIAVKQVMDLENNEMSIDMDNIKLEKKVGAGIEDTELVQGIILDKEKVHPGMPRVIHDAKIALLDVALEIKDTETDAKIQITAPEQMQAFLNMEEKMLKDMVDKVVKSGANVVFCQKGIDDLAQHYLAKQNIYAARRIKKSDLEKLSRAAGAQVISNLADLNQKDLGFAGLVEERKVNDEELTYVTGCKKAKAVTLLIRGGTEHVVDEVERAIKDAIGDVIATVKVGFAVGGAGAAEVEVAQGLRKFANTLSGREQLAVFAFADALEVIPITLAENAGLDPIDMLTELKAAHEKGQKWAGLDVFSGKVMDAWKRGIIEPLKIKTQAIKSASEVAELILRIDDVLAAGSRSGPMPQGMPDMHGME